MALVNQNGMGPLLTHNSVKAWKDPVLTGLAFGHHLILIFLSCPFSFLQMYWWRVVVVALLFCFNPRMYVTFLDQEEGNS